MLKVLSVLHGNRYGGPHNRNLRIASALAVDHGISLTALVPDEPGNGLDRLAAGGVSGVRLPIPRLRASSSPRHHWRFMAGFVRAVRAIKQLLVERGIDVVLINGVSNPHAAFAARSLGIPVVWQMIDCFPPRAFVRLIMPYVRRSASAFMATGRSTAEYYLGAGRTDGVVLFYPPVDLDRFASTSAGREAARRQYGFPGDAFVVGNVANINPQKGHDTFIAAAALLKKKMPSARFVILGQRLATHERYCASLLNRAAQLGLEVDTDLIIRDPGTNVAELAMGFDVFWMTSVRRSEGIATAIEEAMALGLPVVATAVGSVSEVVADGVTGVLVPPHAADEIAAATEQIAADPGRYEGMVASARAASRKFAVADCAATHAEAIGLAYRRNL